jgi:ADP-ribose pyrophosphatase
VSFRGRVVAGLRIVRRLPAAGPGFLTLERLVARNLYRSGPASRPYRFEVVHRRGVDCVAVVPFFHDARGRLMVVLKAGFRPGLYLRARLRLPLRDRRRYTRVIEAVAGSLETRDRGARAISARARAELREETGLSPVAGRRLPLGAGFFPSHGQSTEKIHLRAFEIDPERAVEPAGDGSVNEADAKTVVLEAETILRMCRRGAIEDPKVEIGVTRLCRVLGYPRRRARPARAVRAERPTADGGRPRVALPRRRGARS